MAGNGRSAALRRLIFSTPTPSPTPLLPPEAVISPAVTTARASYAFTKVGVVAPRPANMATGAGNYFPSVCPAPSAAYPDRRFLYFSTDHATDDGGIWVSVCVSDPSVIANWKTYEDAVAAGWLNDIPNKPAANPIYIGAQAPGDTRQCETPNVQRVNGTFVMTYQMKQTLLNADGTNYRNQGTLRSLSSDGINFAGSNQVLLPVQQIDQIGDGHSGYLCWGPNPFPQQPYTYIGYSLAGGQARSTGAMWGTNDPVNGTWTRISALNKWGGRLLDYQGATAQSWFFPDAWKTDIRTARRTRQGVALIIGIGKPASGATAAPFDLYEILLSDDGLTPLAAPQPLALRGAVYDAGSLQIGCVDSYGDKDILYYEAATAANEKTIAMATSPRRNSQNTWFATPLDPLIPATFDATAAANFKALSAIPAGFTEVKAGTTAPVPTFDANGINIPVDGTMATKQEYFLFENTGFIPANTEFVEFYIRQWGTAPGKTAYRLPYIGFSGSKTLRSAMQDGVFLSNGEGTSPQLYYQALNAGAQPLAAKLDDYYWAVGYGAASSYVVNQPKTLGIRWWPQRGRMFVLGEGGIEMEEMAVPAGTFASKVNPALRLYPFFGFSGVGTSATGIERVGSLSYRQKAV